MAESFDQRMERACKDLEIAGAILVGGDKTGKFRYEKAFGQRSLKDPSKNDPLRLDSTMWIASCTKLITTIAVMQCVQRGQLKLDDDVTTILPELKDINILMGFKEPTDEPILVKSTKSITLRYLLTHSSGLSYDVFNPILMRFRKWQRGTSAPPALKITKPITEAHLFPLIAEPGDAWNYSVGIDWAGLMVERVNGNISLEDYMLKNIWGPLGVTSFTFHPKTSKSEVLPKLTDMSIREGGIHPVFGISLKPDGKVTYLDDLIWNMDTPDCQGGAGGYAAPYDYAKVLQSICSDDEKLLEKSTVDEMFKAQLSDASRASLTGQLSIPELNQAYGSLPPGAKVDWGLGGQLLLDDVEGGRRKGTMIWGGHPNLLWFVDRVGGMSGIFASQLQPPGDLKTNGLFKEWEQELYKKASKEKL